MNDLIPFIIDEVTVSRMRATGEIPVNFFNKTGQVIVPKNLNATEIQINGLLKFIDQGLYYRKEDEEKLKGDKRSIPEGLSDTKLINEETTYALNRDTTELFNELKKTSFTSIHTQKSSKRLHEVFNDFEKEDDAMIGLVNILELMAGSEASQEVELAMKRTVIAMAMKTRGIFIQSRQEEAKSKEEIHNLMMAALLADIGYGKMKMPEHAEISDSEMNYIRNHPILSYLMLAHEPTITAATKRIILTHHRPMKSGTKNNNYPNLSFLIKKLNEVRTKHIADGSGDNIAMDIDKQILLLANEVHYDEDAAILALASEFASLTSKVAWRDAYTAIGASKMIINNSYFTYPTRIINDFMNHMAISLCDNQMVLNQGDYILVAEQGFQSDKPHFELCQIREVDRYQSKPEIVRLGFCVPSATSSPRLGITGIKENSFKSDPRKAKYTMINDDTRRIIYIFDKDLDSTGWKSLEESGIVSPGSNS